MSALDWIRQLLGLHAHTWEYLDSVKVGGRVYESTMVVLTSHTRVLHYRRCKTCGKVEQYYKEDA